MIFEEKLIYFPDRYPAGDYSGIYAAVKAGRAGVELEDVWLETEDGVRLHGWYCRQPSADTETAGKQRLVGIHFHGNAGNVTLWFEEYRSLTRLGVDVLAIDYRGYGRSEGKPTERGLYFDARAAWDHLARERGIAPDRIVIYGFSLGGGIAVDLASKVEPAGLIVQSSFTSIPDMAGSIFFFAPRFLVRTRMMSVRKVPEIKCPKLFVHGTSDDLVPYELGKRLYEAAAEPKQLHTVPGAGHNETFALGGERLLAVLADFFRELH